MILTQLHVQNFRCHEDLHLEDLDRLTVLVGENDIGKTVLLEAICVALGARACQEQDFREDERGGCASSVSLDVTFRVEPHDDVPDRFKSGEDRARLRFSRVFNRSGNEEVQVEGLGFSDARFDDENYGVAETQRLALRDYGVTPAARKEDRYPQRDQLVQDGKLTFVPRTLRLSGIRELALYLPRLERVSAAEYADPASVVLRTLQGVARRIVQPLNPETHHEEEREELRAIRRDIEEALNEDVNSALEFLRGLHRSLATLRVSPNIDFSNVVRSVDLLVDTASGSRSLRMHGAGTNRRIWMGLLQWERDVARRSGDTAGSVLRLYDEPDINLHPGAQRELFETISGWANDVEAHTQCMVCTHAITMIDRAPVSAIRLIQADQTGRRSVDRITTPDGEDQR